MTESPEAVPRLIVVAGYPATGKTSLARGIADEMHLPVIGKDDIKEALFDSLGTGDREWSARLGQATYEVMFRLLRQFLHAGVSVVVEANFEAGAATVSLGAILQELAAKPMLVVLHGDPDLIVDRIHARADSGERHPGHLDQDLSDELEEIVREPYQPPEIPGPRLELDAANWDALAAADWIRQHWDD